MRALVVTPPATPTVVELPEPRPRPGEILVDVEFAAVDAGDRAVSEGFYHEAGYISRPTVGLGWDFVGVVREAAEGDLLPGDLQPGDRVVGVIDTFDKEVGTLADTLAVPRTAVTRLPETMPPEHAAVVPVGALTADQAVSLLGDATGSLLVTGAAGAVGGFALSIARERGFAVTGLARPADRAFVEASGATFAAEAGSGYDAVIDTAALGDAAIAAVRDGGRYVGLLPGMEPAAERGIGVTAVTVRADGDGLARLLRLSAGGGMPTRVTRVIGFEEAADAVVAGVAPGERGRTVVRLR